MITTAVVPGFYVMAISCLCLGTFPNYVLCFPQLKNGDNMSIHFMEMQLNQFKVLGIPAGLQLQVLSSWMTAIFLRDFVLRDALQKFP